MKDACRYREKREKREKQRVSCLCTRQQEVAEGQWGEAARVEEVPPPSGTFGIAGTGETDWFPPRLRLQLQELGQEPQVPQE